MYLIYLLASLIFGWIVSGTAKKQGRNPSIWFYIGFFFGLISLALLYFLPEKVPMNREKKPISSPDPKEISPLPREKYTFMQ